MQRWEVGEEGLTVGRGTAVDLKIEDEGLSRRHFMITREDGDYFLQDLNSRNGTWMDGLRVTVARLRHQDPFLAGRSQFRFCGDVPAVEEDEYRPRIGPHDTVVIFATLAT